MREFWIIGGGRFGLRAAETIGGAGPGGDILIVEKDPRRCRELENRGFRVVEAEGVAFLKRRLTKPIQRQWIVAAAPIHVAYEWVRANLSGRTRIVPVAMPVEITGLLPNAVRGDDSQWYASNADFICPPDCSESGRICCFTGRERPRSMHAYIRQLHAPSVKILVVRSYQLAAGVGGLRPRDLLRALSQIQSGKSLFLLATACKCHAVLNSFKVISKN